jgi:hypothetical protein
VARRYDLAAETPFANQVVALTCVDFSVWSSDYDGDTEIFLRIYEDLSPDDGAPGIADRRLLGEASVILPQSDEGVLSQVTPRSDGDISLPLGLGGLPLTGDTVIIVELAHELQARVRWGALPEGPQTGPTYIFAPTCASTTDYQTTQEFAGQPRPLIQRLHFDVLDSANLAMGQDCNANGQLDACDIA